MLKSTLELIQCPRCQKPLRFLNENQKGVEVRSGWLVCTKCKGGKYPIIEGVAILVPEPKQYILEHVKGFAAQVGDDQIPKEYLKDYREAKAEIQTEHIEEDLEAERVVALYLMNHYLRVSDSKASNQIWWRGVTTSELHEKLIEQYWDKGPFFQIETWIKK